jgi:outer membrane receptor for ferrienterochelin and colicin
MLLRWGFDLRRGRSEYDYFRARFSYVPNFTDPTGPDWWAQHDTLEVVTSRTGYTAGAYLADRLRITEFLTLEAGLRYDRQSHTGEQQLSPRLNASLQLTPAAALRAAWGYYHQSQALYQLWAADGDTVFYPAQRAEHRVLELEQGFRNGISLRVEAYQRLLSDPLPEYRSIDRNMGALWEEDPEARIFVHPERGKAEGLELLVKGPGGGRFTWSGAYALSRVEELVEGEWMPRPYDQRHAVNLQFALRPTPDWSFAMGWIYHSPWPYTEIHYRIEETVWGQPVIVPYADALNQGRLIPYRRVDFRASRRFRVGRSDLLLYADVFNLMNRENAMDSEHSAGWDGGRLVTDRTFYPQLGIMPSLGLRWVF